MPINIPKGELEEFCARVKRSFEMNALSATGHYDKADLVEDLTRFLGSHEDGVFDDALAKAVEPNNRGSACAYPAWSERKELGLTIREHFAGLAMEGLLAAAGISPDAAEYTQIADDAVCFADALLGRLEVK